MVAMAVVVLCSSF